MAPTWAMSSFVVDLLRLVLDGLHRGLDRRLDAPLQGHRVGAGRHVAQALLDHGLGQDRRRRGAVAGHVVGLLRHFLDELGPDLLLRVLELDLLGDGHAVVGDRGRAPLLLEDHVATLGAEGDLHRVRQLVHPPLERPPRLLVEADEFGSHHPRDLLVGLWLVSVSGLSVFGFSSLGLELPASPDDFTGRPWDC